jgi:hypothetical protein
MSGVMARVTGEKPGGNDNWHVIVDKRSGAGSIIGKCNAEAA